MAEIPVEKKFAILAQITRAQHFAWHEAVRQLAPQLDMAEVVNKMWEVTAHETAAGYLKRIDKSKPLAPQLATSFAFSSQAMGEDAVAEVAENQQEAFVRHHDCPWFHWHKRLDLLHEDQPGCDLWFQTTVEDMNKALGTRLRVETVSALPDGSSCCLRRFWEEE